MSLKSSLGMNAQQSSAASYSASNIAGACAKIEPSIADMIGRLSNLAADAEARSYAASEIVDRLNGTGSVDASGSAPEGLPSGVLSQFENVLRRLSAALTSTDASLAEIAHKIG